MNFMLRRSKILDKKVEKELGWLLGELLDAGWIVVGSRYSPQVFGNWLVDLSRGDESLRLIKDRNQFSVDDGSNFVTMQAAGIEGVFESWEQFASAVFRYAVLAK